VKPADKPVPRLTNSTYQNTMADQTDNIDLDSVIDRLLEGESRTDTSAQIDRA
jgi:hypothetical protein